MSLPLPFTLDPNAETADPEAVQANFDEVAKQFPLSRKSMAVEKAHAIGGIGEPAFQNSWGNFDPSEATWRGARFWKDPMGLVHLEGLITGGASGTTVFVLPAGYRPGSGLIAGTDMNASVHGRVDVAPTGNVVARFGTGGTTAYFSLFIPPFRQEQ